MDVLTEQCKKCDGEVHLSRDDYRIMGDHFFHYDCYLLLEKCLRCNEEMSPEDDPQYLRYHPDCWHIEWCNDRICTECKSEPSEKCGFS